MYKKILITIFVGVALLALGIFAFKTQKKSASLAVIPSTQGTPEPIFLADVTNHAGSSSCWLVIDDNVYDVTDFISTHPGGDMILQGCGKDATSMFNSRPNDGTSHSESARNILTQYKIGILAK
jgi:cytochrome b involved in lipid metabolism